MGTSNDSPTISKAAKPACAGRMMRLPGAIRLLAAATLALTCATGYAQDFPNRPITIITPASGGATDLVARSLLPKMQASLGQPVVIEARGGGSGNIGPAYVAKAAPDGYTVLLTPSNIMTINPYIFKSLPFDPVKDFLPLTTAAQGVLAIVVHPSMPVNTLAEFIAYAKTQSKPIGYGTAATGTVMHMAGVLLAQRAGINLEHIPYKGSGPALNDLLGGHIQMGVLTLAAVMPFVDSGKIKVLAIGEKSRFAPVPTIPTVAETLPGFEATAWMAFFAPAGTPKPIADRLSASLIAALKDPEIQAKLLASGQLVVADTPAELTDTVRMETRKWGDLIRDMKLQIE